MLYTSTLDSIADVARIIVTQMINDLPISLHIIEDS